MFWQDRVAVIPKIGLKDTECTGKITGFPVFLSKEVWDGILAPLLELYNYHFHICPV